MAKSVNTVKCIGSSTHVDDCYVVTDTSVRRSWAFYARKSSKELVEKIKTFFSQADLLILSRSVDDALYGYTTGPAFKQAALIAAMPGVKFEVGISPCSACKVMKAGPYEMVDNRPYKRVPNLYQINGNDRPQGYDDVDKEYSDTLRLTDQFDEWAAFMEGELDMLEPMFDFVDADSNTSEPKDGAFGGGSGYNDIDEDDVDQFLNR